MSSPEYTHWLWSCSVIIIGSTRDLLQQVSLGLETCENIRRPLAICPLDSKGEAYFNWDYSLLYCLLHEMVVAHAIIEVSVLLYLEYAIGYSPSGGESWAARARPKYRPRPPYIRAKIDTVRLLTHCLGRKISIECSNILDGFDTESLQMIEI